MKLVFMGSGTFAVPTLEALANSGHELLAAVTQPDRESGRGRHLAPPPTKPVAERLGVRVLQPARVRAEDALAALTALAPELIVVVAYGQMLPKALLALPPRGCVNVHASLLPRYRGAAPIQWALANGEIETGVTTMQLDEGLDTGPILLQRSTPVGPEEAAPELQVRLALLGAELLIDTLSGLERGSVRPEPQDHARASLAPILEKADGRVDWALPASSLAQRLRGFTPWPGLTAQWRGQGLRLLRVEPTGDTPGSPGEIVGVASEGIAVACGAGSGLRLVEVQPESRRPMSASAFAAGARLAPGDRFS